MKIKKIMLIIVIALCLVGCTKINKLTYDEIINNFSIKAKNANTFKQGYKYYVPNGLIIDNSGSNYAILTSDEATYYLYVDLISYIYKKENTYVINDAAVYSKKINYQGKGGYIDIKLKENNQYLIEIMYNYAKIEVMVEENLINKVLINSISILNSVIYNDITIERLLSDNKLDYTEEVFEMFKDNKVNSDILQYEKENDDNDNKDEVIDTDFIN